MNLWLVNGQTDTGISPLDRGLSYGDGVFRTLRTRAGEPVWWTDHYVTLARDCASLGLVCPAQNMLLDEVKTVAQGADRVIKITLTRGKGARGYRPPDAPSPTRIVAASLLPDHAQQTAHGVSVRWCSLRLARQAELAGIKHLNRLQNVLARKEWNDPSIAEGLLCDDTGAVIGGTMTNLFVMRGGELLTPDLSLSGIDGVTRSRVLRAAKMHAVESRICRLETTDILAADEVFLGNSIAGLWRVVRLEDRQWAASGWTEQFNRWIHETD